MPRDHAADEKVHAARDKEDGGNLTDTAADVAENEIPKGDIGENAFFQRRKRRCRRDDVRGSYRGEAGARTYKRAHSRRPRKKEQACREGRIDDIFADAAKQTLYNDDGKERTDDRHPDRYGWGEAHRQKKAGNDCGKIADRYGATKDQLRECLKENGGGDRHDADHQSAQAEGIYAEDKSGQKRNDNVGHDRARRSTRADMRCR